LISHDFGGRQPSRRQSADHGRSVATPLERQFGRIAGVTEMTSSSSLGSTSVTMQFDLSRDIDGAARDVEAAINAARGNLPSRPPGNPSYRKGQSGRLAHHDRRADLRYLQQGPDV
jgi:multidrug efflux pump subunit AcrB